MTNETPTPCGDAQVQPPGRSGADRPTAGLRAAIAERVSAKVSHTNALNAYMRSDGDDDRRINAAERRDEEARLALESALAAHDARLARLTRIVRAWDDLPDSEAVVTDELRAARAAITAEDLAERG